MTRTLLAAAVPSNSSLATMDISVGGTLDQQLTIMCKCRWRRCPAFTAVGLNGTVRTFWPYQPSSRLELHTAFGGAQTMCQPPVRTRHICFAPALFPAGMLLCAFQVFFMQSGFAMLEAGTIRIKNMKNIMLKNGKGRHGLVRGRRNVNSYEYSCSAPLPVSRPATLPAGRHCPSFPSCSH